MEETQTIEQTNPAHEENHFSQGFDANRHDLLRYQAGDVSLETVLMERNAPLVHGLAYRFRGRGVEMAS